MSRITAASRLNPDPTPIKNSHATKQELAAMLRNMAYAAGLDVDEKNLKRQNKKDLLSVVNGMTSYISRSSLQSALGQSFYGKRDLYDVLGWKKDLVFNDYLMMYERNGIAARCVDLRANECWRKFPILHDGKTAADYQDETPFLKSWLGLSERLTFASLFNELDIALGISRYSVIVVGVKGDTNYALPLDAQGDNKQIEFMRVLDEGQVMLSEPVSDPLSPRYGLPNMYRCQFEANGVAVPVHWTRVIHFKQGRGRSNVYGIPGLQRSFNSLQDLEKVVGSSSEAFWQNIRRTIILSAKEGFNLPEAGSPESSTLYEQVDNLEHQMRQVIRLKNMDIQQLAGGAVDGRNQHDLLIANIAGTWGYPQRILIGSEEAQLASTADVLNMNNSTMAYQKKFGTPKIRQTVEYLYTYGFIPAPASGKFQVEWESLYDMAPLEKLDLGIKKVQFLNELTGNNVEQVMRPEDLTAEVLDGYKLPEPDEPVFPDKPFTLPEPKAKVTPVWLVDPNVTERVMP